MSKIPFGLKANVLFTTAIICIGVMILVNRVTFLKKLVLGG